MEPIRLDQALEALLDRALDRLRGHNVAGGLLEEVRFIERGDRTNKAPRYPALILTTGIANPVEATALTVKFDVPLRLWSQIYSTNPAVGEPQARAMAARAWHALLKDPAEPTVPGVVQLDISNVLIRPGAFEPPGPGVDAETYIGRANLIARIHLTF